jgi:hypothetical protein
MQDRGRLHVPAEEGAGIFYVPVQSCVLPDGSHQVLEDDFFEYDEPSQLFAFGPGDVVRTAEKHHLEPGDVSCLFANSLVKSGSEVNDYKRLLFDVLENEPDPISLAANHGKPAVKRLLIESENGELFYPGIREYVCRYRHVIEGSVHF